MTSMTTTSAAKASLRRCLFPTNLRLGLSLLFFFTLCCCIQGGNHDDNNNNVDDHHRSTTTSDNDGEPDDATPVSEWYQRYPKYPDYCSTPEQMGKRIIPPLPTFSTSTSSGGSNDNTTDTPAQVPDTRLRHVTAVIRHGARTIASRDSPCWDGYWDNPETAIWNCPLTERLAPPTPLEILQQEGEDKNVVPDSIFLFQKNYDVIPNRNVLEGTCELGQLMAQGYEQLVFNGNMLRETYLYQDSDMGHDERMRLFEVPATRAGMVTLTTNPWVEPNFYLRAEDTQRTMISGQLIMQGLFGPELDTLHQSFFHAQEYATVPVHTGDFSRDILQGYPRDCPRLDVLEKRAKNSKEFEDFYKSQNSQEIRQFMENHLSDDTQLFDCLMTTVCTDRPLPERFGIYSPHPESWFNRIAAYHATNHSFHYQYNGGEFSKLSMGPLWAEILEHILPVLQANEQDTDDRARPPSKMAVYAGHDTTLIQLLSSLGVWDLADWPPYASMMLIEIHEMVDDNYDKSKYSSGFAFRLLHDGEVLTNLIDGCSPHDDLCDAQVLLDHLLPIANRAIDCTLFTEYDDGSERPIMLAKSILSETAGILLLLVVITVSALLGSIGAFFYLTGTLPTDELLPKKHHKSNNNMASNGIEMTGENGRASAKIEPFEISMADANDGGQFDDP